MAEMSVEGNGHAIAKAIEILQRYETPKRAKVDVSMNDLDAMIVYLNTAKPEQQPKVSDEDIEALGEAGFVEIEADGYTTYVLR